MFVANPRDDGCQILLHRLASTSLLVCRVRMIPRARTDVEQEVAEDETKSNFGREGPLGPVWEGETGVSRCNWGIMRPSCSNAFSLCSALILWPWRRVEAQAFSLEYTNSATAPPSFGICLANLKRGSRRSRLGCRKRTSEGQCLNREWRHQSARNSRANGLRRDSCYPSYSRICRWSIVAPTLNGL